MHASARMVPYLDGEPTTVKSFAIIPNNFPVRCLLTPREAEKKLRHKKSFSSRRPEMKRIEKKRLGKETFFILNTLHYPTGLRLIYFPIIMSTIITSCQRFANPMEIPFAHPSHPVRADVENFPYQKAHDFSSSRLFPLLFCRLQWDRYERDTIYLFFAIYTIFDGELLRLGRIEGWNLKF